MARGKRAQVTIDPEVWAWITYEGARSGIPPAVILRGWIMQNYRIARRERDGERRLSGIEDQ